MMDATNYQIGYYPRFVVEPGHAASEGQSYRDDRPAWCSGTRDGNQSLVVPWFRLQPASRAPLRSLRGDRGGRFRRRRDVRA